jgi:hypothetical protein
MFFKTFAIFWNKIEKKQENVCNVSILWLDVALTSISRWMNVDLIMIIECKINFVFQIVAILFFFIILILHWNDQIEWLSLQLAHFLLFVEILHVFSLCCLKQIEYRRSYWQTLIMWSYYWQLKHCLIQQLLTKNSHVTCVYSFNKSFLINLFSRRVITHNTEYCENRVLMIKRSQK